MLRSWPVEVAEPACAQNRKSWPAVAEMSTMNLAGPLRLGIVSGIDNGVLPNLGSRIWDWSGRHPSSRLGSGRSRDQNRSRSQQFAARWCRQWRIRATQLDGRRHADHARFRHVHRGAARLDIWLERCRVLERCARLHRFSIRGRGAICGRNRGWPACDARRLRILRGWALPCGHACLVRSAVPAPVIVVSAQNAPSCAVAPARAWWPRRTSPKRERFPNARLFARCEGRSPQVPS